MKIKGWIAKDRTGRLFCYIINKPFRKEVYWHNIGWEFFKVDAKEFPNVKWEDEEPFPVEIEIKPKTVIPCSDEICNTADVESGKYVTKKEFEVLCDLQRNILGELHSIRAKMNKL